MPSVIKCICGHDLSQHPPDPLRPFAWPCRACECSEYHKMTNGLGME